MSKSQSQETYAKWIYECQHNGRGLTDWEEHFIESLDQQMTDGRGITPRQAEILERIYAEKTRL